MRAAAVVVMVVISAVATSARAASSVSASGPQLAPPTPLLTAAAVPNRAPNSPSSRYAYTGDSGWAVGAGILGIVSGVVVLSLAGGAAVNVGDISTSIPLGAAATVLAAVTIPITAAGAASGDGEGSLGLRITGWVLFGLTMADAVAELALGAAGGYVPAEVVWATGLLGVASAGCMSADAFIAAHDARSRYSMRPPVQPARPAELPTVMPRLAWAQGASAPGTPGAQIPVLALGGHF